MLSWPRSGHSGAVSDEDSPAPPQAMRELVRDYVATMHATYLDHVQQLTPGERGALPLVAADGVTVVAAAARRLHLLATTDRLPAARSPEVEFTDGYRGVLWTVRFFDPSTTPELGLLADDSPADVRRILGVADTVYHLAVTVGGGLSAHHAQHSGLALANQHAKTTRDLERVRRALPRRLRAVDEFAACVRNGLDLAAALLAADLTSGRVVLDQGATAASCLEAVLDDIGRRPSP